MQIACMQHNHVVSEDEIKKVSRKCKESETAKQKTLHIESMSALGLQQTNSHWNQEIQLKISRSVEFAANS